MPEPTGLGLRPYARQTAVRAGIPPDHFERQIQQESGFDPAAFNAGSGATGIAQIIARFHPEVDPTDPIASLDYAADWMAKLWRQYGSYGRALAAYNWGPGNVAGWDGSRGGLPAETRHYLDVILGDGWPEPTTGAPSMPTPVIPFNPDAPCDVQPNDWACSLESVQWLLRSIGRNPDANDPRNDPWLKQQLVPAIVSPTVGLQDASGRQLAAWLNREYGSEMGFMAHAADVTFDDVLAGAGVNPTMIGGRNYGPGGHWVGVRRADENGWLDLANPAPNFTNTGTHLDRAEWAARGPWSAVYIDRAAMLGSQPGPVEPPSPADPLPAARAHLLTARAEIDKALSLIGG